MSIVISASVRLAAAGAFAARVVGRLGQRVEHLAFHAGDVVVPEDFVRALPLDADRADGRAVGELTPGGDERRDRIAGQLGRRLSGFERDVGPAVHGTVDEDLLALLILHVLVHVRAYGARLFGAERDDGGDDLRLVDDKRDRLSRDRLLSLALEQVLAVAVEGRGGHRDSSGVCNAREGR